MGGVTGVTRSLITCALLFITGSGCERGRPSLPKKHETSDGETRPQPASLHLPVTIPLNTPILGYDPAEARDRGSRVLVGQIFDTLFDWGAGPSATQIVPELAADLPRFRKRANTLVIRLRRGATARRFVDDPCFPQGVGRIVRASDVRDSLLRHADPSKAGFVLLADRIENFARWAKTKSGPVGIVADDNSARVEIRLTRPQPEFLGILANPQMAIVPSECVAYYDGKRRPAFRDHPVGSGPFFLDFERSRPGQRAVLRRRQPSETRLLREVQFEYFRSPETALRLFQHNELGLLSPGQSQFAELFSDGALLTTAVPPGTRLHKTTVVSTTLLMFKMDDAKIGASMHAELDAQHLALRRAIGLAFDIQRYHRVLRNGAWSELARHFVPPLLAPDEDAGSHPYAPRHPDLPQAHRLLERAGLKGRRHTLTYLTEDHESARQEATILREALHPIGVDLRVIHDAQYLSRLVTADGNLADIQLFSVSFDADYPDADSFLRAMTCEGALARLARFCDSAYDRLFAEFTTLPPGPGRSNAIAALEAQLAQQLPFRPIDHPQLWQLEHPDLGGVQRHPFSGLRVERLYLRRRP